MSMTSYNFFGQGFKRIAQGLVIYALLFIITVAIHLLWVNLSGDAGMTYLDALLKTDYAHYHPINFDEWQEINTWCQHTLLQISILKPYPTLLSSRTHASYSSC